MSTALLADMFYAAPELWYGVGAVLLFLLGAWFFTLLKLLKLRQKNYFLNRDRERSMLPKTAILLLFIPTKKSMTRIRP